MHTLNVAFSIQVHNKTAEGLFYLLRPINGYLIATGFYPWRSGAAPLGLKALSRIDNRSKLHWNL